MSFKWILLTIILVITGCNVGPPYRPPCVEKPCEWKAAHPEPENDSCVGCWWEIFDDDLLTQLEIAALANNPNIYIALERVIEARAMAGVKKADLYPQITLDPSYSNRGMLFQIFFPKVLPITIPPNAQFFRIHQMQYTLPLNMSYELDLWGRLRNQYYAAYMNAEAQEEALRTTILGLTTDLAISYFQMRSLDAQIDMYDNTIKEFEKSYRIANNRYNSGIVNYLDVAEASTQLTNAESSRFDLIRQRNLEENKIAILAGFAPSDFCLPHLPLINKEPPIIPAGIPSMILLQRPDIAEAEREMASESALVKSAYAAFLPSFEITGALGFSSPDLKQFLSWKSRYWAMGANIGQTIFDAGRKWSNLSAEWARFHEASGNYQETVLTAFKEVEDALNNLDLQSKQIISLRLSTESAKRAVELSNNRYRGGLTNYLEVVDNQRTSLDTDRAYISLQGLRYISTVQLIKALGGSWEKSLKAQSICFVPDPEVNAIIN